ncbi:MAG: Trk system potassium transporter TrkA [Acidobacteria bacterium]|nr:Trk system potassium transporter TrkA [Acidobacteriota bacterium]
MRILIVGGGQVAALVARRLSHEGNEIVVVEQDPARCAELEERLDARIVQGNANRVGALRAAGLRTAEMLIAVTDSDQVNLLACLIAQAESSGTVKVARVRTHEVDAWREVCRRAGLHIDLIIHPESETVSRILPVLRIPGVSDIIDFAGGQVKLFGMNIEAGSWTAGKTMEELDRAGPPRHSLIAMVFRGPQVIIPHGGDTLEAGDHVYVVSRAADLERTLGFMGVAVQTSLERVFVVGGKQIGIQVALELEAQGVSVKLFEQNRERCERIAQLLRRAVIVHGDGTDEAMLREAHIEDVDAFLSLTGDDEDNIIACLLARRLGAKKVVALVNRLNYLPMAQRLGINTTVSPRVATVDRILRFVRKGRVQSVTTFRQEEAEAIELLASARSRYVGRKLREVRLPRGCLVGSIVRPSGEALVPRGDAQIEAGDRVIFFALTSAVPKLESLFLAEPSKVAE